MATLNYYDAEREWLPPRILNGIVLEKDITTKLNRMCRFFGVPRLRWELWDENYSCYNPTGYDGSPPNLRFVRDSYKTRKGVTAYTLLRHFLHEIAHYLDDRQRTKEIEALFRNDIQSFVHRSMKIRNAKWHGPRHRAQMVLLVKWWLSQGSK